MSGRLDKKEQFMFSINFVTFSNIAINPSLGIRITFFIIVIKFSSLLSFSKLYIDFFLSVISANPLLLKKLTCFFQIFSSRASNFFFFKFSYKVFHSFLILSLLIIIEKNKKIEYNMYKPLYEHMKNLELLKLNCK